MTRKWAKKRPKRGDLAAKMGVREAKKEAQKGVKKGSKRGQKGAISAFVYRGL